MFLQLFTDEQDTIPHFYSREQRGLMSRLALNLVECQMLRSRLAERAMAKSRPSRLLSGPVSRPHIGLRHWKESHKTQPRTGRKSLAQGVSPGASWEISESRQGRHRSC